MWKKDVKEGEDSRYLCFDSRYGRWVVAGHPDEVKEEEMDDDQDDDQDDDPDDEAAERPVSAVNHWRLTPEGAVQFASSPSTALTPLPLNVRAMEADEWDAMVEQEQQEKRRLREEREIKLSATAGDGDRAVYFLAPGLMGGGGGLSNWARSGWAE